ncbi:MAG: TonB-dependent receptor [Bacteroidia bacterium]|nr:TonB-dependent receptor [Bacteroidia bacterium]
MRRSSFFMMLLVGGSVCSFGQVSTDTTQINYLDEVLVSDTKFESKRRETGKMVIRIGQEELSRSVGQSLAEIINRQAGLEINGSRSRQGEVLGVFARGGRGRQVVVFVDGVRVSDPSSFSGTYDLRLINPAAIETIEILKGANSTLYGANAATAVLYITTKKAVVDGFSAQITSSFGTNQTTEDQRFKTAATSNNVVLNGRNSGITYGAEFGHSYTDGISSINTDDNEEDKNELTTAAAHIGWQISDSWDVRVRATLAKLNTDYDESFGLQDAAYSFLSEQKGIFLSSKYGTEKTEIHLKAGMNSFRSENISAFPGDFEGQNSMADLYGKFFLADGITAIAGLNYLEEKAELAEEETFEIWDPYLQLQGKISPGIRVNAGVRLHTHSAYDTELVYAVNPVFTSQLGTTEIKLYGSYASAYLTPTLNQLYGDFGANAELEPESNRTAELGAQVGLGKTFQLEAVYFDREEENAVIFDNMLFQYENASTKIMVKGVELALGWKASKKLRLTANYTYTDRQGDAALRIPKHKAAFQGIWSMAQGTNLTLQYSYTGKRVDTDFNTFSNEALSGFSLVDLHLSHDIIENKFQLFLRMDNLFNTKYTEIIGFNTRGRNLRLGVRINL